MAAGFRLFCRSPPDTKITPAMKRLILPVLLGAALVAAQANAQSFSFTTGAPDGRLATGSRPDSAGKIEIESADDFILTSPTQITSATFTGLLPAGVTLSSVGEVQIEIYRVFPNDSNTVRTINVKQRMN